MRNLARWALSLGLVLALPIGTGCWTYTWGWIDSSFTPVPGQVERTRASGEIQIVADPPRGYVFIGTLRISGSCAAADWTADKIPKWSERALTEARRGGARHGCDALILGAVEAGGCYRDELSLAHPSVSFAASCLAAPQ